MRCVGIVSANPHDNLTQAGQRAEGASRSCWGELGCVPGLEWPELGLFCPVFAPSPWSPATGNRPASSPVPLCVATPVHLVPGCSAVS